MKRFFPTFVLLLLTYFQTVQSASALSLPEAVDIALSQNPSLSQSQKAVETADQQLKIAKGQRGFALTLSGSADSNKSEGVDISESAAARLTASVPLYSGGKLQANIRAADIYTQICQLDFLQAADDLAYQVAIAYVDALEGRATHQVDCETRDNLASHEQLISDLYTAGAKAKIDFLRAQVETSNANQDAVKSLASYEVSLTNLATLLSLDAISDLNLVDIAPKTADYQLPDVESCIFEAEQSRSDLIADYLRIQRGEQQLKSAKSAWLPSLNASASTGFNAQSDSWKPTNSATAGLSASWNVFDSHVTRAEVDSAKIELERLALALKTDTDSAHSEVISAHKNLSSALSRLETTQIAVNLAVEERYIATEKYRAGEGILLDVLDAEVALSTAKKNHVSARYDVLRYQFALRHALGNTFPK